MTTRVITPDNPYHPGKPFFPCRPAGLDEFAASAYRYRTEAVLPCSPDALFDVFEDPVSWTVWAVGIKNVEWTSPKPYRVGTTRTVTFADGTEVYERFVAWERGREMAFVLEGHTTEMFKASASVTPFAIWATADATWCGRSSTNQREASPEPTPG